MGYAFAGAVPADKLADILCLDPENFDDQQLPERFTVAVDSALGPNGEVEFRLEDGAYKFNAEITGLMPPGIEQTLKEEWLG